MNAMLILGIIISLGSFWSYLANERAKELRAKQEAERRELETAYHKELAVKYAATMTDADRDWFNRLPDWDRMPLFREQK